VTLQKLASELEYAVHDPSKADARVGEDAAVEQDEVENVGAHSTIWQCSIGSHPQPSFPAPYSP
jgi:hypothetical protein